MFRSRLCKGHWCTTSFRVCSFQGWKEDEDSISLGEFSRRCCWKKLPPWKIYPEIEGESLVLVKVPIFQSSIHSVCIIAFHLIFLSFKISVMCDHHTNGCFYFPFSFGIGIGGFLDPGKCMIILSPLQCETRTRYGNISAGGKWNDQRGELQNKDWWRIDRICFPDGCVWRLLLESPTVTL